MTTSYLKCSALSAVFPLLFACLLLFSSPSRCVAAPQAGQGFKEKLFRDAAKIIFENESEECERDFQLLHSAATSQGEFELAEQLRKQFDFEFASTGQLSLCDAVQHDFPEAVRSIIQIHSNTRELLANAPRLIEDLPFMSADTDPLFELLVQALDKIPDADYLKPIRGQRLVGGSQGESKEQYLDTLRFDYAIAIVQAKQFTRLPSNIEKIKSIQLRDAAKAWWLFHVPGNEVFPDGVAFETNIGPFAIAFGRACHAARKGDIQNALEFFDDTKYEMQSAENVYLAVFFLSRCLENVRESDAQRSQLLEVLKRSVRIEYEMQDAPGTKSLEEIKDTDAPDALKQILSYMIEIYSEDWSLDLPYICDDKNLWTSVAGLAELTGSEARALNWIEIVIAGLAGSGNRDAANQLLAETKSKFGAKFSPNRDYLDLVLGLSAAKEGKFSEARQIMKNCTALSQRSRIELAIAIRQYQLGLTQESRPFIEKHLKEMEDELKPLKPYQQLGKVIRNTEKFAKDFRDQSSADPYKTFFIEQFDEVCKRLASSNSENFSKFSLAPSAHISAIFFMSDSLETAPAYLKELVLHSHEKAKRAAKLTNALDFTSILVDLKIRDACYKLEAQKLEPELIDLSGKAPEIINFAKQLCSDEACDWALYRFVIEFSKRGDEDGTQVLLNAIDDPKVKLNSILTAAVLYPPHNLAVRESIRDSVFPALRSGGVF